MKLKHKPSGKSLEAIILEVANKDYLKIEKDNGFSFNWNIEKNHEVYKIYLVSNADKILGLMSLTDLPGDLRIHLNLLEVTEEEQGGGKELDFVAGCLLAFAAKTAMKRGYYGFVSLEPKTALTDLYQNKYGFRRYGRYLGIEGIASENLIKKYLQDEK